MKNYRRYKPLFILVPVALFLLVSYIVMLLWNAILPEVVMAKPVSYWQAAGILVLSKILFGGFHGKCGGHKKKEMWQKMHNMSDEEKEKFREKMKDYLSNSPLCKK